MKVGQGMSSYISVSGDMWDMIAKKTLGSELHKDKLIKANIEYSEIFIFPAGIKLNIPALVEEVPLQLPPWKRGLI